MTGRKLFEKFGIVIFIAGFIWKIFPAKISEWLLVFFRFWPGRFFDVLRFLCASSILKRCGSNVYIATGVVLKGGRNAVFGSNLSFHDGCYIDATGGLVVGDNVSVAHQVSILTFNHTWSNPELPIKYNPVELKSVVIEDDVWIGCGVRIMPGVTVGRRSVIAAGSVVTRDVPRGTLVAGVPARVVRSIVE